MFEINTNYTIEESKQLLSQTKRLANIHSEIFTIIYVLEQLSCMDSIVEKLRTTSSHLETEGDSFLQLTQALDMINYCYLSGEKRVCQNAEEGVISFRRKQVNRVEFGYIASMFEEKSE